jgi:glycerate dehydrogenase
MVADYLKPFNPIISYYDPTVAVPPEGLICCKTLDELFSTNDIVTIHAGLNDYTIGTVNYKLLSMLPQDGILINTARGPIVVEEELGKILHEGKIRAGIDVSAFENDFKTSPYANTPNTILTGHAMAYIGKMERIVLQEISYNNINRFIKNEQLKHVVTPEKFKFMT